MNKIKYKKLINCYKEKFGEFDNLCRKASSLKDVFNSLQKKIAVNIYATKFSDSELAIFISNLFQINPQFLR